MEDLKRYLVSLPAALDFKEHGKVKVNVYKALYYAVSGQGKYAPLLFASLPPEELEHLKNYLWQPKVSRSKPFYKYVAKHAYTHPPNQTCGRPLLLGEPVYRCQECGYDDTCVICVHCFNRADHVGHSVMMYTSRRDSSGMCDCGDETAFVRPLNCNCQQAPPEPLPEELSLLIESTIRVVLDYILDVANFSVNTLPLVHRNINSRGEINVTSLQLSDFCSLPAATYGAVDANSDEWHLVLWNDENHDYPEAETGIRAASGVDDRTAKSIAMTVNSEGRAILRSAPNYADLLKPQRRAEVDGLVATIMSSRDYMREQIVGAMVSWLADVVAFSGNDSFREECRRILPKVLLEPGFEFSKVIPSEFFRIAAPESVVKQHFFENGLLFDGELLNLALTTLKPGVSLLSIMAPVHNILRAPFEVQLARSRIQYLLAFEIRLVANVRKKLIKSILPMLFVDAQNKATFCQQYIDVYPIVLTVLALSDREEQIASTNEIATQLFTCPKTNMWVVTSGKLGNILGPLSALIEEHSARKNESGLPNLVDIIVDIRSKREKSSIQRVISDAVNTFHHIVSKNNCTDIMNVFLMHDNLMLFLNFLKYFQGAMEIVRKYGDHVERELLESFYSFLQRAVPLYQLVSNICTTERVEENRVTKAALLTFEFLSQRNLRMKAPGIADFRVSKDPVSYMNPENAFFSYLLQNSNFEEVYNKIKSCKFPFVHVSDFSLRSIVLVSQVKVGFWIRNGISVSRQIIYYTDSFMNDVAYYRDFHLNQVAIMVDDPKVTLFNFLDRWELLSWYAGEVSHDKTVYDERFGFMCSQFVIFLYVLLTDRFFFDNSSSTKKNSHRVKNAICYALCEGPKAYSRLKTELSTSESDVDNFDELLLECANYQEPTGLTDFGMYRLKPELYDSLDPVNLHLDASKSETIMESLISNIAKAKKIDEKKVILKPDLYYAESSFVNKKIGEFTRTTEFAKLIYKLLQYSLDAKDEQFLPYILHLIHAVIIDDEQINGQNHLLESFITIPISDLLMTVADSTMASHIVLKADFLLDLFVSKDNRILESLIDCFGEEHVQSYKKRKVGLFESDAEKKKRQAEGRKARIMKKFAKQREQFMEQNKLENDDQGEVTDEQSKESLKCVICGEDENTEDTFGLLLCANKSSIFWKLRPEHKFAKHAFQDWDFVLKPEGDNVYPIGYPYSFMREDRVKLDGSVAFSCTHGMHYACFEEARRHHDQFPCPLCHAAHDNFIPRFLIDSKPFVGAESLDGEMQWVPYKELLLEIGEFKAQTLIKTMLSDEYLDEKGELKKSIDDVIPWGEILTIGKVQAFTHHEYERVIEFTTLLANTVRSQEMTTRLEGNKAFSNFLEQIPNSAKMLIRSMAQFSALSFAKYKSSFSGPNFDLKLPRTVYENMDSVFNEIVALFFQTDYSWHSLMRMGFAKLVATNFLTLDAEYIIKEPWNVMPYKQATENQLHWVKENLNKYRSKAYSDLDEEEEETIESRAAFFGMERSVLPFLRQCAIFTDILTSEQVDLSTFQSIDKFAKLKEEIENQEYPDSPDALCKALNLPKIEDILACMYKDQEIHPFEGSYYREFADIYYHPDKALVPLEYPGVIRLIDLPDDYQDCVTDRNTAIIDQKCNAICLLCGSYQKSSDIGQHSKICCEMPIFFKPISNTLEILIFIGANGIGIKIPAPYLTIHGEIKKERQPGKATLNRFRYNYLSKLWLNQGLYGFASRSLFGVRAVPRDPVELEEIFNEEIDSSEDEFDVW